MSLCVCVERERERCLQHFATLGNSINSWGGRFMDSTPGMWRGAWEVHPPTVPEECSESWIGRTKIKRRKVPLLPWVLLSPCGRVEGCLRSLLALKLPHLPPSNEEAAYMILYRLIYPVTWYQSQKSANKIVGFIPGHILFNSQAWAALSSAYHFATWCLEAKPHLSTSCRRVRPSSQIVGYSIRIL